MKPKRHHFVPKCLLKRFTDAEGWLHYSRSGPSGGTYKVRPEGAFVEGHLYSTIEDDGTRNPFVESQLAQLESAVEPINQKMVESARRGMLPDLTPIERQIWDIFLVVQWRRVPDLHATVTTDTDVRRMLATIRSDLKLKFPERSAEIDAFADPAFEARTIQNVRTTTIVGVSERVQAALRTRGIALLRIKAPNKAFIIAGRPVIQMGFTDGLGLLDEATEMWLPVSSDLAIGAGRRGVAEAILDLEDASAIRRLNLALARQSSSFASRSPALTRSIARSR